MFYMVLKVPIFFNIRGISLYSGNESKRVNIIYNGIIAEILMSHPKEHHKDDGLKIHLAPK